MFENASFYNCPARQESYLNFFATKFAPKMTMVTNKSGNDPLPFRSPREISQTSITTLANYDDSGVNCANFVVRIIIKLFLLFLGV